MSNFIQMNILTSYPPSNLNRDDGGKPKTAYFNDELRLRIASQCLKRAMKTSSKFKEYIDNSSISVRSRRFGSFFYDALATGNQLIDCINGIESEDKNSNVDAVTADKVAKNLVLFIGSQKGKEKEEDEEDENTPTVAKKVTKSKSKAKPQACDIEEEIVSASSKYMTNEVCVLTRQEINNIGDCIKLVADNDAEMIKFLTKDVKSKELKSFRADVQKMHSIIANDNMSVDVAMFGRMMTAHPKYNVDAGIQVAHAITVHKVTVDYDYFSAVDDLNSIDDIGSAHLSSLGFAAGIFYLYVNIDRDLLKHNLGGDEELTKTALRAITECLLTVSPSGKQNSFASVARASYALVTKGKQQPFELATAFAPAIRARDILGASIESLRDTFARFEKTYGKICEDKIEMNVYDGKTSMHDVQEFVAAN